VKNWVKKRIRMRSAKVHTHDPVPTNDLMSELHNQINEKNILDYHPDIRLDLDEDDDLDSFSQKIVSREFLTDKEIRNKLSEQKIKYAKSLFRSLTYVLSFVAILVILIMQ
jgi:hypothetical protein